MNIASRLSVSFVPGLLVTFLLFVLMYVLILNNNTALDERVQRKIADIWQPERELTENIKEVKPEKPDEPDQPPPNLPEQNVDIDVPLDAVSIAAPAVVGTLDIGLGGGFSRDTDYIPVYVPQPTYPRRAQSRGVSGYAVVEVIITATGGARDPRLIEESPENYGFGSAALRAANKLNYNPRVVDGKAVEVPGVMYKFSFQIEK